MRPLALLIVGTGVVSRFFEVHEDGTWTVPGVFAELAEAGASIAVSDHPSFPPNGVVGVDDQGRRVVLV